jgi:N-formylmaleamate deformylase
LISQDAIADLADIPATSRWFSSGQTRLHALNYAGPTGAPAVVVLPGITMPAIGMDFVARELTDRWRPIVMDSRGRGLSDTGTGVTLADSAGDVEALIAHFDLHSPILLGHSLGARIAAAVARRGRCALRAILVVDPPMSGPGRAPYPTPCRVFEEQLAEAYAGTTTEQVAASSPRWPQREQGLRARWLASCDRGAVVGTHAGFESEDFLQIWSAVRTPAVFVRGGDSPVVTEVDFAEAQQANPDAAYRTVARAGHMVFWDNPDAALAMTRAALADITTM